MIFQPSQIHLRYRMHIDEKIFQAIRRIKVVQVTLHLLRIKNIVWCLATG